MGTSGIRRSHCALDGTRKEIVQGHPKWSWGEVWNGVWGLTYAACRAFRFASSVPFPFRGCGSGQLAGTGDAGGIEEGTPRYARNAPPRSDELQVHIVFPPCERLEVCSQLPRTCPGCAVNSGQRLNRGERARGRFGSPQSHPRKCPEPIPRKTALSRAIKQLGAITSGS